MVKVMVNLMIEENLHDTDMIIMESIMVFTCFSTCELNKIREMSD